MRVHFIAIGGSAMHNLAIALKLKGYEVSGSDDEIFEPSRSRLEKHGLLPSKMGWFPESITKKLDQVILGMHARADNPELAKAKELGLKIFSYPEYLYEQTRDKQRIVIGGSHGKTTITAMILHVMQQTGTDCDYMVGAQLAGFDTMVRLTKEAPIAVIEGDEYLSSPIDRRPKFHLYRPHVAVISGISWDHINVFPTFENYVEQFSMFTDLIEKNGRLIYCIDDLEVKKVAEECDAGVQKVPYSVPEHITEHGVTALLTPDGKVPLRVFGRHNLMNLNAARMVCHAVGIADAAFYSAIASFNGADKRLALVAEGDRTSVFKDFAHSPSKLKATLQAVKEQFADRQLVACMELHTFSSLNRDFLKQYDGSMDGADVAIVYFNPETLKHKKLPDITRKEVKKAFGRKDMEVFTDANELRVFLLEQKWKKRNLLMMSSGTFDGLDLEGLGKTVTGGK